MRLREADGVVDVDQRIRIAARTLAEVERRDGDAVVGEPFVVRLAAGAIVLGPDPAVQFDQRRERPRAVRLEQPHQQRLVAMTEIFHVLDVEFLFGFRLQLLHRHGHFSWLRARVVDLLSATMMPCCKSNCTWASQGFNPSCCAFVTIPTPASPTAPSAQSSPPTPPRSAPPVPRLRARLVLLRHKARRYCALSPRGRGHKGCCNEA